MFHYFFSIPSFLFEFSSAEVCPPMRLSTKKTKMMEKNWWIYENWEQKTYPPLVYNPQEKKAHTSFCAGAERKLARKIIPAYLQKRRKRKEKYKYM